MDPNPWSWMSGSIRKGIGKDGCLEREQFSRIQMSFIRTNWESQSNFFVSSPFILDPPLPRPFLFFLKLYTIMYKRTKQDQEVGSKDGVVDAWYEGIF